MNDVTLSELVLSGVSDDLKRQLPAIEMLDSCESDVIGYNCVESELGCIYMIVSLC